MSGVTTCPHDALLDFPAIDITVYARGTYRQPHYAVTGGVQAVEKKLAKNLTVNLRATVTGVENISEKCRVTWVDSDKECHLPILATSSWLSRRMSSMHRTSSSAK